MIDQKDYPDAPKYVDPIMALLTIGFLIISSASMTKKAGLILLQSLPEEIEDEEEIKIYDDGKLHHLKRFEANITEAVYADDEAEQSDILRVNVTLNFRHTT